MIKGMEIILYETTSSSVDEFGHPIKTETEVTVDNVLFQPTLADDVVDRTRLESEKELITLAIPKGDNHSWLHNRVLVNGHYYMCYAENEGMEQNIPLAWNKKVYCERYE